MIYITTMKTRSNHIKEKGFAYVYVKKGTQLKLRILKEPS